MDEITHLDAGRHLSEARAMPSLPHSIASTLDDSPYRLAAWNAVDTGRALTTADRGTVVQLAKDMHVALQPCRRNWLKGKLAMMALVFGHERDPDRAAAWLAETGRLLWDLPESVLDTAIDEAIKRSERGFMPGVGQIRAIADPIVDKQRRQADRLERVAQAVSNMRPKPVAAVARPPQSDRDQDSIPPAEVAAFNRNMAQFGCAMRADSDGKITIDPEVSEPRKKPNDPVYGGGGTPLNDHRRAAPRTPTREDYIKMGVDPAVLDHLAIGAPA